jgi:MFS family permease
VRAYFGNERLFNLSTAAFAISTVFIGLSTLMPVTLVFMTIAGAAWIFTFTTTTTCIQFCSPRWVMGRAVALSQVSVVGSIAMGAAFWGFIAEHSSLLVAFACGGAFLALSLLMTFFAPLPGREFEDLSPHPAADVPAPALKVEGATGPVFITIEYEVPRDQIDDFLATMYAIGRIRKRDGARRWGIQQDIDNPNIWVERIESATWTDHLRRANRATVADQAVRRKAETFRLKGTGGIRRTVERPQGSTPLD